MGMVLVIIAFAAAIGGLIVGGGIGLLVGLVKTPRVKRGRSSRGSSGVVFGAIGALLGMLLSCGVSGYFLYETFAGDGPPHGYENREQYRDAEMEAQMKRIQPTIAALEKYKADRGRYPKELKELVEKKYLDVLPPIKTGLDHQGEPNRVWENGTGYRYLVSPNGDAFAINLQVSFSEDKRMMTMHRESRNYRSGALNWEPGSAAAFAQLEAEPQPLKGTKK